MQDKPDICIVTFYDSGFRNVGDLAWDSMHRYAERYGYASMRFDKRTTDRPQSWEKILCIQKAFDLGYRFALWIDADAIVVDASKDIRSVITDAGNAREGDLKDKDFFIARHDIGGRMSPNLGVMLVRNSESSRRMLRDMWSMEKYATHRWWEQAAFMEYFGLIRDLPSEDQLFFDQAARGIAPRADASLHIEWIDEKWNFVPGISRSGAPVIRHYAGRTWFLRLCGMIPDAMRCGYLRPKDGLKYAKYALLFACAKARLIASRLWQMMRTQG